MPITSPYFDKIIRECRISIPRCRPSQSERRWSKHTLLNVIFAKHDTRVISFTYKLVTTSPVLMNEPPEVCLWEDGFQLNYVWGWGRVSIREQKTAVSCEFLTSTSVQLSVGRRCKKTMIPWKSRAFKSADQFSKSAAQKYATKSPTWLFSATYVSWWS